MRSTCAQYTRWWLRFGCHNRSFNAGSSPLRFGDRPYRGQVQASVANGALRAVNVVGLEAYLYGVVPSEWPRDWLPEALKAQAVAARSYALAEAKLR